MTRIGSVGSLGVQQLRALNRLTQISAAIAQNTMRLSTLKRINSAKDDPSGLIQATILEQELSAAESASRAVTRANSLLSTADSAAGEVITQLQAARVLAVEAADGTLSDAEIAANQIQIDAIVSSIANLSQTSFAGKRLLDGSASYRATGVNTSEILDVDVDSKSSAADVTVSIEITTQATQATDDYTGGALGEDVTLIVSGSEGSTTVSLSNGASLDDIADAINAVTDLTGVEATVNGGDVDFNSSRYGSDATISIEATAGTFVTTAGAEVSGTDAVATVNGESFTGDGSTFTVNTSEVSFVVEVDPTANGTLTDFTISGEGLNFVIGSSATSTARIGLPTLNTASLGGIDGPLQSIASGGDNTLTSGKYAEAIRIIDDAIGDATRGQAIIGGFQKYTLASAENVLDSSIINVSAALSDIQDTDVALETALLANNLLLEQSTLQSLAITTFRQQDILSLLTSTAGFRF